MNRNLTRGRSVGVARRRPSEPRRKEALKRLGVSEVELRAAPDISSLLKQTQGGLKAAMAAMRFSLDPAIEAFLEKYDAVPDRDRRSLSWEAIALAADVEPASLLGGAILAIQAHAANAVKIIALSNHPEITRKRVEFGKLAGGVRDRDALDTALGFLPQAKGSTFIINPGSAVKAKSEDDEEESDEDNIDHLFPSLSETQEKLLPLKARLLEAGS